MFGRQRLQLRHTLGANQRQHRQRLVTHVGGLLAVERGQGLLQDAEIGIQLVLKASQYLALGFLVARGEGREGREVVGRG